MHCSDQFATPTTYGPDAGDFVKLGGRLQLGPGGTLIMEGDTVVKATLKQSLEAIRGQPRIIPLFRPTPNGLLPQVLGSRVNYEIVGFGGIIVLEVLEIDGTPAIPQITDPVTGEVIVPYVSAGTKTLRLLVQPEFVIDGSAIGGGHELTDYGLRTSRFVYRPLRISR